MAKSKSSQKKKKKGKLPNSQNKDAAQGADKCNARLIFTNGGQTEGFTNSAVSQFSDVNPSSTIREFIQNSLDAAIQAGKKTAEVHFIVKDIKCSDIPGMDEYKIALKNSIKDQQNMNAYNNQSDQVAQRLLTASNKPSFSTLFVIDNGVGFGKPSLEAIFGDGISIKEKNDGATGSHGNGHLTAFCLSELQYILYGGVQLDNSIFGGHAIIASHTNEKNEIFGKDGYYACNLDAKKLHGKFSFPTKENMPSFIKPHIDFIGKQKWESGAIVAIPAFNNFGKDNIGEISDLIVQNAAINFFVAIHKGALRININIGNQRALLDKDNLNAFLEKYKNQRQSTEAGFPSGANAWCSYQTLINGEEITVDTGHGEIQMRVRKDEGEKNIVLCRNGMWISKDIHGLGRAKFADKKPFDLLILAEDSKTDVYTLFKAAEGPLHNSIKRHRLGSRVDKNNVSKKKFDECINNIFKKVDGLIETPAYDIWRSPFMPFGTGETINAVRISPKAGTSTGTGTGAPKKPGTKKKSGTGKKVGGNKSPSKNVISVKMASRQPRIGFLDVSFIPSDENDDGHSAELRLNIDRGTDATCTGSLEEYDWDKIRFKNVKVFRNNEQISENDFIKDGNNIIGVNIGEIKANEPYKLEIEYDDKCLPISGNYTISYAFTRRKKVLNMKDKNHAT